MNHDSQPQGELSIPEDSMGVNLLSYLKGKVSLPDNSEMINLVGLLLELQYNKEKYYGSSWKLKGEYRGIIPNIDRKYDRLNIIVQNELDNPESVLAKGDKPEDMTNEQWDNLVGESKIDTVADLTVYCLLYLTFLKNNHQGAFDTWVRRNLVSPR